MKKHIITNIISIITALSILVSCNQGSGGSSNPPTTTKQDIDETNSTNTNTTSKSCTASVQNFSFKTKSLDSETKPNENFKIKILKKTFEEPIMISNKYRFPLVFPIDFNGVKIEPAVVVNDFHKALTEEEVENKRKLLYKEWKKIRKEQYKHDRKLLINQQKEERIIQRDKFKELLKNYPKGSIERKNFIKEQIELREDIAYEDRDEREELKQEYLNDIKEFKKLLSDTTDKEDKSFSTKAINVTDVNLVNMNSETQDYSSINQDKSFKINNTYVDGVPYSDADPEIVKQFDSYLLSGGEEVIEKSGLNVNGCLIADTKIQKIGNKISVIFNKQANDCQIKEVTLEYKVISTNPQKCGQSNTISMSFPNNKPFAVMAEIPFEYLGEGDKQEVYFNIKDENGNVTSNKIGELKPTPAKNEPPTITDFYTYDNVVNLIKQTDYDSTINEHVKNYKFSINNLGTPFYFSILDKNNKEMCKTNCLTNIRGSNLITIDKSKFLTGMYDIILTDKPTTEPNYKTFAKKEFFVGNYPAVTFSSDSKVTGDSAMVYSPTSQGYFNFYNIQAPTEQMPSYTNPGFVSNSSEFCNINEFQRQLYNSSNQTTGQGIDNLYYQKYLFSKVLEGNQNRYIDSTLNNCKDKAIVVGGMVDLTNPDKNINKQLYDKNYNILLSLVVEDEACNELVSKPFGARAGTKFLVTKQILPNNLFGNFCKSKVFYVKIKKLVDASPFNNSTDPLKSYYEYNIQNIDKTATDKAKADFFSVVKNVKNEKNNLTYEGNRTILEKCNDGYCYTDAQKIKDDFDNLNIQLEQLTKLMDRNNQSNFETGSEIDIFSNGYDFDDELKVEKDGNNIKSLSGDLKEYVENSTPIKRTIASNDTKNKQISILKNTDKEFNNLQNSISEYKEKLKTLNVNYVFSGSDTGQIQAFTGLAYGISKVIENAKTVINKLNETTNKTIDTSGGKILSKTVGVVFARYNFASLIITGFMNQQILLQNNLSKAKQEYIKTVGLANKVLYSTITDSCKRNADSIFLHRVRRYLINFITDPLELINQKLDVTTNENDIIQVSKELETSSINLYPRANAANTATDNQCKEKDCIEIARRKFNGTQPILIEPTIAGNCFIYRSGRISPQNFTPSDNDLNVNYLAQGLSTDPKYDPSKNMVKIDVYKLRHNNYGILYAYFDKTRVDSPFEHVSIRPNSILGYDNELNSWGLINNKSRKSELENWLKSLQKSGRGTFDPDGIPINNSYGWVSFDWTKYYQYNGSYQEFKELSNLIHKYTMSVDSATR